MAYTGDPLQNDDRSPFLSFLDYIDEPGQVVKNLLRGNLGAAGRHVLNFAGDTIDAALPGDWIPKATTAEDNVTSSELIGLDEKEHPILGFGANLVGDTLLNPLSYLSLGAAGAGASAGKAAVKAGLPFMKGALEVPGSAKALEAAGGLAKKGFQALPEGVQKGAQKAGDVVRSTFGAERPGAVSQGILAGKRGASIEAEAGMKAAKQALEGLDARQRVIVGDAIRNWRFEGRVPTGELSPGGTIAQRIAAHGDVRPEEVEKLATIADSVVEIGRNQKGRKGIFSKESQERLSNEYLPQSYRGLKEADAEARTLGSGNAMKERKIQGWEDERDFLSKPGNEGVEFVRDPLEGLLERSQQQGKFAAKADLGAGVVEGLRSGKIAMPADPEAAQKVASALGKDFALDDSGAKEAVKIGIEQLRKAGDRDGAKLLTDAWDGLPERGWIGKLLDRGNSIFKPAATAGYVLPKMGFNVRNRLSGLWSTASNEEARGATGSMLKRFVPDMVGAITDGLGLKSGDKLGKVLQAWEGALAKSGGSAENALKIMEQAGHPDVAGLLRAGVLDGFVRSEDILSELTKPGIMAKLHRGAKWPLKITKGIEDRMRLGLALDVLEKVKDPQQAARIARDTLFDYDVTSSANRNYRTAVPFGQYLGKAVPQQAKLLAEKPAVGVGLASAFSDEGDSPIYPYMEGKLNVPLGSDEEGNDQYASGFGLPFEALNQIPGSMRDVKRNVVGSMTPPIKSALSAVFGEDPYFETPYGSYDKMPIAGKQGDLGEAYNMVAGTGLIQPLDSPLRLIDQILDPRRSAGIKALDMLTGAKVVNVDPDVAIQQQLQEALKGNPNARQFQSYFADEGDDATLALIRAYQEAKAALKAKRKRKAASKD
jgi:hypothetical protein